MSSDRDLFTGRAHVVEQAGDAALTPQSAWLSDLDLLRESTPTECLARLHAPGDPIVEALLSFLMPPQPTAAPGADRLAHADEIAPWMLTLSVQARELLRDHLPDLLYAVRSSAWSPGWVDGY